MQDGRRKSRERERKRERNVKKDKTKRTKCKRKRKKHKKLHNFVDCPIKTHLNIVENKFRWKTNNSDKSWSSREWKKTKYDVRSIFFFLLSGLFSYFFPPFFFSPFFLFRFSHSNSESKKLTYHRFVFGGWNMKI